MLGEANHEEIKDEIMKKQGGLETVDEEFARSTIPTVTVIDAGKDARNRFGHQYGSQCLSLSREQIKALTEGKQLAIDIMEGEYVLFVTAEP